MLDRLEFERHARRARSVWEIPNFSRMDLMLFFNIPSQNLLIYHQFYDNIILKVSIVTVFRLKMTEKLENQKRRIWSKHERSYGQKIPYSFRNQVERMCTSEDTFLEDLDDSIPDYLGLIDSWRVNHSRGVNGRNHKPEPESGYRKPFERRLHLVEFVAGEVLNMVNLALHVFSPHKRIKWGLVCEKWNKDHPYDIMTPAVLKAEYYRAIRERGIQRQYFLKQEKWVAPFKESILRLIGTDDPQKLMRESKMDNKEAVDILSRAIEAWIQYKKTKEAQNERVDKSEG